MRTVYKGIMVYFEGMSYGIVIGNFDFTSWLLFIFNISNYILLKESWMKMNENFYYFYYYFFITFIKLNRKDNLSFKDPLLRWILIFPCKSVPLIG